MRFIAAVPAQFRPTSGELVSGAVPALGHDDRRAELRLPPHDPAVGRGSGAGPAHGAVHAHRRRTGRRGDDGRVRRRRRPVRLGPVGDRAGAWAGRVDARCHVLFAGCWRAGGCRRPRRSGASRSRRTGHAGRPGPAARPSRSRCPGDDAARGRPAHRCPGGRAGRWTRRDPWPLRRGPLLGGAAATGRMLAAHGRPRLPRRWRAGGVRPVQGRAVRRWPQHLPAGRGGRGPGARRTPRRRRRVRRATRCRRPARRRGRVPGRGPRPGSP